MSDLQYTIRAFESEKIYNYNKIVNQFDSNYDLLMKDNPEKASRLLYIRLFIETLFDEDDVTDLESYKHTDKHLRGRFGLGEC